MASAAAERKRRESGQLSLFELFDDDASGVSVRNAMAKSGMSADKVASNKGAANKVAGVSGCVSVRNVTKAFSTAAGEKIALKNVSFEIEQGSCTVIGGENGSGKSTVLSLVSCAFHNESSFCPMSLLTNQKKIRRHYTYSDFFAFTAAERGFMSDIKITSTFLTSKPKNTDTRCKIETLVLTRPTESDERGC